MNYKFKSPNVILIVLCCISLHSQNEKFILENKCGLFGINSDEDTVFWNPDETKSDLFPKFATEIMKSSFWNINDDRIKFIRFSSSISSNTLLQVSLGYKTNNTDRRRIFQYDFEETQKILKKSRYKTGKSNGVNGILGNCRRTPLRVNFCS